MRKSDLKMVVILLISLITRYHYAIDVIGFNRFEQGDPPPPPSKSTFSRSVTVGPFKQLID